MVGLTTKRPAVDEADAANPVPLILLPSRTTMTTRTRTIWLRLRRARDTVRAFFRCSTSSGYGESEIILSIFSRPEPKQKKQKWLAPRSTEPPSRNQRFVLVLARPKTAKLVGLPRRAWRIAAEVTPNIRIQITVTNSLQFKTFMENRHAFWSP
jgi:hypothetical protein